MHCLSPYPCENWTSYAVPQNAVQRPIQTQHVRRKHRSHSRVVVLSRQDTVLTPPVAYDAVIFTTRCYIGVELRSDSTVHFYENGSPLKTRSHAAASNVVDIINCFRQSNGPMLCWRNTYYFSYDINKTVFGKWEQLSGAKCFITNQLLLEKDDELQMNRSYYAPVLSSLDYKEPRCIYGSIILVAGIGTPAFSSAHIHAEMKRLHLSSPVPFFETLYSNTGVHERT